MPSGLQWLSYLAGASWPKGDEDALFALGDDWHTAATSLHEVVAALRAACDTALANYSGDGEDKMKAQFDKFFTGDQSVEKMSEQLKQLGDAVRQCGTQVEYSKLQIIITLAILAAEIAYALATLWGAWAVPAMEAEAAIVCQTIGQRLVSALASQATRMASMPMWKLAAIAGISQAGIGFGTDLLVQGIQIGKHHRDGMDVKQLFVSAGVSGISGLVAAPVGSIVGKQLGNWVGHQSMTWWKAGGIAIGAGIPAGVVGAGAGIVANGVFTGQWEFDPAAIIGGVGGGLIGGVHGVAEHARTAAIMKAGYLGLPDPPFGLDGSHDRPERIVEIDDSASVYSDSSSRHDDRQSNYRSPSVHTASSEGDARSTNYASSQHDSTGNGHRAQANGSVTSNAPLTHNNSSSNGSTRAQSATGSAQPATRGETRSAPPPQSSARVDGQSAPQPQTASSRSEVQPTPQQQASSRSEGQPTPQAQASSRIDGQSAPQPQSTPRAEGQQAPPQQTTRSGLAAEVIASQQQTQPVNASATGSPAPPAQPRVAAPEFGGNQNQSAAVSSNLHQQGAPTSQSSVAPQSLPSSGRPEGALTQSSSNASVGSNTLGDRTPPAQPIPPQSPRPSVAAMGDGSARPPISAGLRTEEAPNTPRAATAPPAVAQQLQGEATPAAQEHRATPSHPSPPIETPRDASTPDVADSLPRAPRDPDLSPGQRRDFPAIPRFDSGAPPVPTPPGSRLDRIPGDPESLFRAIDHATGGKFGPGPDGVRAKFVRALQDRKDEVLLRFSPDTEEFREAAREIARLDTALRTDPDHPDRLAWLGEHVFRQWDLEWERAQAFDLQLEQLARPGGPGNELGAFLIPEGADALGLHLVVTDDAGAAHHFGPPHRPEVVLVRHDAGGGHYEAGDSGRPHQPDGSTGHLFGPHELATAPNRSDGGAAHGLPGHRNDCGPLALDELFRLHNSPHVRPPTGPIGLTGMSAAELQHAAGAPLQLFDGHDGLARHLGELGDGAAALIVDTYRGPADQHGVGAHAYLLVNEQGTIMVRDPSTGADRPFIAQTPAHVESTHAVLYTPTGLPHSVESLGSHPLPGVRIGAIDPYPRSDTFPIGEFLDGFGGIKYPPGTELSIPTADRGTLRVEFTADEHVVLRNDNDPPDTVHRRGVDDFWNLLRDDHETLGAHEITVIQPAHVGSDGRRVWEVSELRNELRQNGFDSRTSIAFHDADGPRTAIVRKDGAIEIREPDADRFARPEIISRAEFETRLEQGGARAVEVTLPVPDSWYRVAPGPNNLFPTLARILNTEDVQSLRQEVAGHLQQHQDFYAAWISNDELDSLWSNPENHQDPSFQSWIHEHRAELLAYEISALYYESTDSGYHFNHPAKPDFALYAATRAKQMNITTLDPNQVRNEIPNIPGRPQIFLRRAEDGAYEVGINRDGAMFSVVRPDHHPEPSGPPAISRENIPAPRTRMLAGGPEPLLEGAALRKRYLGEGRPLLPWSSLEQHGSPSDFAQHPLTHFHTPIHYMDSAERETHRVFVGPDGRLYNVRDGQPFDTTGTNGTIFVMDEFGNLYAAEKKHGLIQHSTFFGGRIICAAGFIDAVDGHLTQIMDSSGHYMPDSQMNDYAIALLRTQGLQIGGDFQRVYMSHDGQWVTREFSVENRIQQEALERAQRILEHGPTPTRPFKIYRTDQAQDQLGWHDFRPGTTVTFHGDNFATEATATHGQRFHVVDRQQDGAQQQRTYNLGPDALQRMIFERDVESVKVEQPEFPVRNRPELPPGFDEHLNQCGPLALHELVTTTGSTTAEVPDHPVGLNGMSAEEFQFYAGAPLQSFADHRAIGQHLLDLGPGATALVVDGYRGPTDAHGIGAHAYLFTNDDGTVVVKDPSLGTEYPLTHHTVSDIDTVHAVVYTPTGEPRTVDQAVSHPLPAGRIGAPHDESTHRYGITDFLAKFDGSEYPVGTKIRLQGSGQETLATFTSEEAVMITDLRDTSNPPLLHTIDDFWDQLRSEYPTMGIQHAEVVQPAFNGATNARVREISEVTAALSRNEYTTGTIIEFQGDSAVIVRRDGALDLYQMEFSDPGRARVISRAEFENLIIDREVQSAKVELPSPDSWFRIGTGDEQLFPTLARILNESDPAALQKGLASYLRQNAGRFVPMITNDRLDAAWRHPENHRNPRFEEWMREQRAQLLGNEILALRGGSGGSDSRAAGPSRPEFAMFAAAAQHKMNLITLDSGQPREEFLFGGSRRPAIFLRRPETGGYEVGVAEDGTLFSTVKPSLPDPGDGTETPIPRDEIPPPHTTMRAGGPEPPLDATALRKRYISERRPLVPVSEFESFGNPADFQVDALTHFHTPIHYMDAAEREAQRRFVGPDGRLYNAHNGLPFDTRGSTSWIFVMDEFGNFYSTEKKTGQIQHSSFLGGRTVCGAGFVEVSGGYITGIMDSSGHYMPHSQMNDYAIAFLRHQGLQLAPGFERRFMDLEDNWAIRDPELETRIQDAALDRLNRILTEGPTPTRPFKIHRVEESYAYLQESDFRTGTTFTFHDKNFTTTVVAKDNDVFGVTDRSRDGSGHRRDYDADAETVIGLIDERGVETVKIEQPEYPPTTTDRDESGVDLTALREALPATDDPPQPHSADGPPAHAATEDAALNNCAKLSLDTIAHWTGSDVIRTPEDAVGPSGMSVREFENAAGASIEHFRDHAEIASHLFRLGDGAVAVVIDSFYGAPDEHGVGAHAFLISNEDGDIVVTDPITGEQYPLPRDEHTPENVRSTDAVVFTEQGQPYRTGAGSGITGAEAIGDVRIGMGGSDEKPTDIPFRMAQPDPEPGGPKRALTGLSLPDGEGPAAKTTRLTDDSGPAGPARPQTAAEFAAANPHAKVTEIDTGKLAERLDGNKAMSGMAVLFGGTDDPVTATVLHDGNVRVHSTNTDGTASHEIITRADLRQLIADRNVDAVAYAAPTPAAWYQPRNDGEMVFSTIAHVLNAPDPQKLRNDVAAMLRQDPLKFSERFIPPGYQAKMRQAQQHWNTIAAQRDSMSDEAYSKARATQLRQVRAINTERTQQFLRQIEALRAGETTFGDYRGGRMDFMLAAAGRRLKLNILLELANGYQERFTMDPAKPYIFLKVFDDDHYEIGVDHRGDLFSAMPPIPHELSAATGDIVAKADIPPKFTEMLASAQRPALSGAAVQYSYFAENRPMRVDTGLLDRLPADRADTLRELIDSGALADRPRINPTRHYPTPVHYMDELERETHRLFIGPGGRFFRAFDGKLFDTTVAEKQGHLPLFVEDEFGNFYAAVKVPGVIQHSSFFGGRIVTGAGFVTAKDGFVTSILSSSGHYRPGTEFNDNALAVQRARGLVLHPQFSSSDSHLTPRPADLERVAQADALARAQRLLDQPDTATPPQVRYYRTDQEDHLAALSELAEQGLPQGGSAHFTDGALSTTVTFADGRYEVRDVDQKRHVSTRTLTAAELIALITEREIASIAVTTPGTEQQHG